MELFSRRLLLGLTGLQDVAGRQMHRESFEIASSPHFFFFSFSFFKVILIQKYSYFVGINVISPSSSYLKKAKVQSYYFFSRESQILAEVQTA